MLGPCRLSGPSAMAPLVVFSPAAEGSMVNDWVWPLAFWLSAPVAGFFVEKLPVKLRVTMPVVKSPAVLVRFLSFRKYR